MAATASEAIMIELEKEGWAFRNKPGIREKALNEDTADPNFLFPKLKPEGANWWCGSMDLLEWRNLLRVWPESDFSTFAKFLRAFCGQISQSVIEWVSQWEYRG